MSLLHITFNGMNIRDLVWLWCVLIHCELTDNCCLTFELIIWYFFLLYLDWYWTCGYQYMRCGYVSYVVYNTHVYLPLIRQYISNQFINCNFYKIKKVIRWRNVYAQCWVAKKVLDCLIWNNNKIVLGSHKMLVIPC